MDTCPACQGRRLSATWEERKVVVERVTYVGLARVTLCKTCKHKVRNDEDVHAFEAAVEKVAHGELAEGVAPHRIERQTVRWGGLWAFGANQQPLARGA